jgi:hypothetical protein
MNDVAAGAAESRTFRLIYRSHNRIPAEQRKVELGTLFTEARSNNKRQHITGALLLAGDWFVQTLEGDETAVRALYSRIATDPRHDAVSLLDARLVDEPAFPRWSMASVSTDGAEPDTYLIAHQDGISPAAGRGSTPEQESVLGTMREAARAGAQLA